MTRDHKPRPADKYLRFGRCDGGWALENSPHPARQVFLGGGGGGGGGLTAPGGLGDTPFSSGTDPGGNDLFMVMRATTSWVEAVAVEAASQRFRVWEIRRLAPSAKPGFVLKAGAWAPWP